MKILNNKNYFLKDVIHGEIVFRQPWVVELLKCREITRLIRIKQLGLTYRLFPNATHNRFVHSLGVYAIVNMVVDQLHNIFNKNEINELSAAALLHDIGHGPHSHAWENYTKLKHEKYSIAIILDKNTDVNRVLRKHKINPQKIVDILNHKHPNKLLNDFISSQIDVDRLDYLARDSHFTGVCYGNIDVSMLIKWLLVVNNKICFHIKAVSSIENFLLARYHMYEQIYEQPKTIAMQILIQKMLLRFKYLWQTNKTKIVNYNNLANYFIPWLSNKNFNISQYLKIDDLKFELFIDQMQYEHDPYIQEAFKLYATFINSDYKIISYSKNVYTQLRQKLALKTKFPDLYIHKCKINTKEIYKTIEQPIWIYNDLNNKIMSLLDCSALIKKIIGISKLKEVIVINKIK